MFDSNPARRGIDTRKSRNAAVPGRNRLFIGLSPSKLHRARAFPRIRLPRGGSRRNKKAFDDLRERIDGGGFVVEAFEDGEQEHRVEDVLQASPGDQGVSCAPTPSATFLLGRSSPTPELSIAGTPARLRTHLSLSVREQPVDRRAKDLVAPVADDQPSVEIDDHDVARGEYLGLHAGRDCNRSFAFESLEFVQLCWPTFHRPSSCAGAGIVPLFISPPTLPVAIDKLFSFLRPSAT